MSMWWMGDEEKCPMFYNNNIILKNLNFNLLKNKFHLILKRNYMFFFSIKYLLNL